MSDPTIEIRDLLVSRRKELGISQRDLAARMKTTQSSISQLEHSTDFQMSMLIRWAEAVECGVTVQLSALMPFAEVTLR